MSPAATRRGASAADVRSAYAELTGGKHREYVELKDLRAKLGGTREQQDATLHALVMSQNADLAPHSGQARHAADQQAAAWKGNHLIALEPEGS